MNSQWEAKVIDNDVNLITDFSFYSATGNNSFQ